MTAILEQDPRPVSSIGVPVPRPVEDLLDELLAKDPARRPPSAGSVSERLRAIEDHLPLAVQGEPPSRSRQTAGHGRRRIGLGAWAGAVAIAASVLIGLAVLWTNLRTASGIPRDPSDKMPVVTAEPGNGRKSGDSRPGRNPIPFPSGRPIKVGLLHSLTGPFSVGERPMVEAESLAIEEINESGGVLGRPVEKVIGDGRSDEFAFAESARKLIERDGVDVLVGCLSSASRKRVKDVCEQKGVLLFYPMIFEALEQSPAVVYVGGGPNQQLLPMVRWAVGFFDPPRRRFFLLGTESLYSRAGQEAFRGELKKHNLEPVGVRSIPLGQVSGFDAIVGEMRSKNADIVLDTLEVESDQEFFKTLGRTKITAAELPVVSMCLGDDLLRTLDHRFIVGHYSALNYFETIDTPENAQFLKRLRSKHAVPSVNASMESAYLSVLFWKHAVEKAGSLDAAKVRAAVAGQELRAPEGLVRIDPVTYYGSRIARIGRMSDHGTFEIVYASHGPMNTLVYPPPYDRAGWENFLSRLSASWGGRWMGGTAPE